MKATSFICILFLIPSCSRYEDNFEANGIFDPPFNVNAAALKAAGYGYVSDWSWYSKANGDTTIIYHANFEEDPVFSRLVSIGKWDIRDSVGIRAFVESKNGAIQGPVYQKDGTINFFVQGRKSGLYSKCRIMAKHLQIVFFYPDYDGVIRSKFRKPTANGFSTGIGPDNEKYSWKIME